MLFPFLKKYAPLFLFIGIICTSSLVKAAENETRNKSYDYIKMALGTDEIPKAQMAWVDNELRPLLQKILKNKAPALRYRYWQKNDKTVWIMNQVGKVLPITMGITIQNNKVLDITVLEYRESHGSEIKYSSFRDQFTEASLKKNTRLNKRINGISGATLSVNATKKMVRIALLLHKAATIDHDTDK